MKIRYLFSEYRGCSGAGAEKLNYSLLSGERKGGVMEITICIGSSCHLKGARDVIKILERLISLNGLQEQIALKGSFCMGECSENGVCVYVDGERFHVSPSETEAFFQHEVKKRLNA